jgi:hypothetical protein
MARTKDEKDVVRARRFASDYFRKHRHDPENFGHPSHLAAKALKAADDKFSIGYGVEGFAVGDNDSISYINTGDSYGYTVLFDSRSRRFSTGTWGDIVEREGI